ncbi:MAG TPA: tRNA uridine-5-carboxymethylaminomethyl(34) synthesis GTPase MnmE, partial [Clostridiales bacterium]|nr:tRNA uridine-5-carboxymethylaminomethyl(34) synthesis GTPase MnmE [Clostridiales bacterium]
MDTITAVSTPPGNGGIGIVRISGPDAFPLSEKFFRPADRNRRVTDIPSRMAVYGHVVDPTTGE